MIWTDVVQTFIYVGGTLVGLVTILHLVPGGWTSVEAVASGLHKFQVFDFSLFNSAMSSHWPHLNFAKPYTLWAGIIGGAFFTTASHGTDQLIVQRLLAARNQRQSALALLSSGVAVFFQFALFLFVGVMLFAYYRVPSSAFGRADRIYPTFIVSRMPHGISGLLIAAILAEMCIRDRSVRLRSASAKSSVRVGSVAVRSRSAAVGAEEVANAAAEGDAASSLNISSSDISFLDITTFICFRRGKPRLYRGVARALASAPSTLSLIHI